MPSQTPMEAARTELRDKMKSTLCQASDDGRPFCAAENSISSRPCYCEAAVHIAITAYLAALPEDKETVERVARAIYLAMYEKGGGRWEANETQWVWREYALAAITATGR